MNNTLPRILVNSIPKSGTNMITRLLSLMPGLQQVNMHLGNSTVPAINGHTEESIPVGVDMPRAVSWGQVRQALEQLQAGNYLSCHIPFSEKLDTYIRDNQLKMILVVRDPRDVVASHARYIAEMTGHPFYPYYAQRSPEERIFASIRGGHHAGNTLLSIAERVQSMLPWLDNPNVLLVRFEDLVGAKGGGDEGEQRRSIEQVAAFLGVSLTDADLNTVSTHLFGASKTFRKGQIASWKTELSADHALVLQSMPGISLEKLGYELLESSTPAGEYLVHANADPVHNAVHVQDAVQGDDSGRQLIFLVSQPRSGSTLMQRVLGGHSDIYTLAEPWIMLHPLYAMKKQGLQAEYDAGLAQNGLEDFIAALPGGREDYLDGVRQMAATWYNRALAGSGKRLFLDKTPRYYYIIPELGEVFPHAKVILLFRNPLSVLSSILKTWVGKNWARLQLHRDDILRGPALMVQGAEALGTKAIVLRYEDFVRASDARLKHLCLSLEVEFEPGMLNYGDNPAPEGRMGDSVGIHQHSRPTPASLDKWKSTFTDPAYHLLAEIMLTLVGEDIVNGMGYNFKALWQELQGIEPTSRHIPQNQIANMVAALHLSKESLSKVSHLFMPYLESDKQAAAAV